MENRAEEFVNSKAIEMNGLPPDKLTVIKWLTEFAKDEVKAINFTDSSLQLPKEEEILSEANSRQIDGAEPYSWAGGARWALKFKK